MPRSSIKCRDTTPKTKTNGIIFRLGNDPVLSIACAPSIERTNYSFRSDMNLSLEALFALANASAFFRGC